MVLSFSTHGAFFSMNKPAINIGRIVDLCAFYLSTICVFNLKTYKYAQVLICMSDIFN